MRVSLRANAALAIAASAVLIGAGALADDLLVMPYACSVVDGEPVLRRARDEGHAVLGRREQRNFTACSPANPDLCRQFTIYRFDLDCDGARAPWMSVVAAAARGHRYERVWIEDGRLRMDMGPRWAMSPDDPCARPYRYDDGWRSRRLDRYCADRRELDRSSSIVDMPPGFAPMIGIDGIFVAGGGPNAASASPGPPPPAAGLSPPPFKGAGPEASPSSLIPPPEPATKSARPLAPPEPPGKAARAEVPSVPPSPPESKSARAETSQPSALPELAAKGARIASLPPSSPEPTKSATNQEPASTARPSIPLNIKEVEAKPPAPPPTPAPAPPAATPGGPIVPKIINRPAPEEASSQPAQAPLATTVPKAAAGPEVSTKIAAIPSPAVRPRETVAPESPPHKAAVRKDEDAPATLMSVIPSPATGTAIGVGILAVALLAAFALTRRRERVRLAGRPRRDIATVSLDGRTVAAPAPSAARRIDPPVPPQATSLPPSWDDLIPSTREEALQVLGMGVTPDTNLSAIKKIVDGLRASWHPDHASGQADRQVRELRLKQINAAWEIIAGKRAVA